MIIIPAVDIKNGKCVRLIQGKMDEETIFSDSPVDMAKKWESMGAEIIHVVDLDGAIDKKPTNLATIKEIMAAVNVPIQIGGGIRDLDTIRMYMDAGAGRIIIGTEAIRNPDLIFKGAEEFPTALVVGIDARDGLVAVEGWTETTKVTAVELAQKFDDAGLAAINFTDIHRDGMQTGPNIEQTQKLAEAVKSPVVASGGVAGIQDITNLLEIEDSGVVGVIAGRALYTGGLDLVEAIKVASGK